MDSGLAAVIAAISASHSMCLWRVAGGHLDGRAYGSLQTTALRAPTLPL